MFPFSTSGCIRRLHINFQGGPHRQKSKDHFLFCPAPFHALCKRAAAALHRPAAVLERKAVTVRGSGPPSRPSKKQSDILK